MEDYEKIIRSMAADGDGRVKISRRIIPDYPEVSEWFIRKTIEDVREEMSLGLAPERTRVSHGAVIAAMRPIEINLPEQPKKPVNPDYLYKFILFGDTHAPFHSKEGINVLCKIIRYERERRLDKLGCLGDSADFYTLSRFIRDPRRLNQLNDELVDHALMMGQVTDAAGDVEKDYTPGNHEERLGKYIFTHAPNLAALPQLQLPELLGIKSLGWTYHPDYFLVKDSFLVTHGNTVSQESGATARTELANVGISGATGHTHRMAVHFKTNFIHQVRDVPPNMWLETGHLSDPSQIDYTIGRPTNWQPGFVMVSIDEAGLITPTLVRIHQGRAMYDGKLFTAD